jgi:F-type H+-transporting ATPase subunit delta
MTAISNNDIARAVYLLLKDESHSEQINISQKIVKFLFRRRLLLKAPEILLQLRKIINQEEGRIIAKVASVEKLSERTKEHLKQFLKKRYLAKEVVLAESIDFKLLGGLKVEANNEIFDLSIKNKIGKLQEYLTQSA